MFTAFHAIVVARSSCRSASVMAGPWISSAAMALFTAVRTSTGTRSVSFCGSVMAAPPEEEPPIGSARFAPPIQAGGQTAGRRSPPAWARPAACRCARSAGAEEDAAEGVEVLGAARDPGAVLGEQLAAGGGEAAGGAVQGAHRPGVEGPADVLGRGADGQVDEGVVVEVAGPDLGAELVVGLHGPAHLSEQPPTGGRQAAARASDDADRAGQRLRPDRLPGRAGGQVVEGVAVEVARGQRPAEQVRLLYRPADLGEQPPAGRAEPTRRAVEDAERPGGDRRPGDLARRAGGQVAEGVAVEVAGRQRGAEHIALLDGPADLGEQLPTGGGQPAARAAQHADRPGGRGRPGDLPGGSGGQVGEVVAVEVTRGQGRAELVALLDRPRDLGEEAAAAGGEAEGRAVEDADRAGGAGRAGHLT